MAIVSLSPRTQSLILGAMRAIAHGSLIDDKEFHTRLGISRRILLELLANWPAIDASDPNSEAFLGINNCMNEICNGVNLTPQQWAEWFDSPRSDIERAYEDWSRSVGRTSTGIQ